MNAAQKYAEIMQAIADDHESHADRMVKITFLYDRLHNEGADFENALSVVQYIMNLGGYNLTHRGVKLLLLMAIKLLPKEPVIASAPVDTIPF